MSFEETATRRVLKEWAVYYLNFDKLKRAVQRAIVDRGTQGELLALLWEETSKTARFYNDRERWCLDHWDTLQRKAEELDVDCDLMAYLRVKKPLSDFSREVELLAQFLAWNREALAHVMQTFKTGARRPLPVDFVRQLQQAAPMLFSSPLEKVQTAVAALLVSVTTKRPPMAYESNRKVYTIGCFDLFHRGHENLLATLREFGDYVVVGIHDDESYFQLKQKYPIDPLPQRIRNIKPWCDMVFVIPATDPTPYMEAMVSESDVSAGSLCYVRGEDMVHFPSRDYVESVMSVYFIPRSEGVSSTLLRTVYHNPSSEEALAAAFAKTDEVGRPILATKPPIAAAAAAAAAPTTRTAARALTAVEAEHAAASGLATSMERMAEWLSDAGSDDVGAEASGPAAPPRGKQQQQATAREPAF